MHPLALCQQVHSFCGNLNRNLRPMFPSSFIPRTAIQGCKGPSRAAGGFCCRHSLWNKGVSRGPSTSQHTEPNSSTFSTGHQIPACDSTVPPQPICSAMIITLIRGKCYEHCKRFGNVASFLIHYLYLKIFQHPPLLLSRTSLLSQ